MIQIQITKSGRKIKLWQLLLAITVVGVGLGMLPESVGVPTLFVIVGTLVASLLCYAVVAVFRKLVKK